MNDNDNNNNRSWFGQVMVENPILVLILIIAICYGTVSFFGIFKTQSVVEEVPIENVD